MALPKQAPLQPKTNQQRVRPVGLIRKTRKRRSNLKSSPLLSLGRISLSSLEPQEAMSFSNPAKQAQSTSSQFQPEAKEDSAKQALRALATPTLAPSTQQSKSSKETTASLNATRLSLQRWHRRNVLSSTRRKLSKRRRRSRCQQTLRSRPAPSTPRGWRL